MALAVAAAMPGFFEGPDAAFQVGVLGVIVLVHSITVLGVLPPWLGFTGVGLAVQVTGNALAAMIYYTYYLAATTDPGGVPPSWVG